MTTTQQTIELDDVPLKPFHIRMAGLTFGAHFNDGFAIGIISIVLSLIGPEMGLSDAWRGALGAGALFGLFLGSLILGWVSDYLGRQRIFLLSFLIITFATIAQFWVTSPMELLILRVIIGFGIGGDYSVGHALLSEFSPRKQRGVILASFSVIWTFGYVFATVLGVWIINMGVTDAWRWMLISPGFIAALILVARLGTPESPRWLMQKGETDKAMAIVHKYFGPNVVLNSEAQHSNDAKSGFLTLFSPQYLRRTLFNCIFFACIVMPYFAIYTFLPDILEALNMKHLANEGGGFVTEIYLSSFLIVGALVGLWCTHKMTRRAFLISSFVALTLSLFTLGFFADQSPLILVVVFAFFTLVLSAVSNLVGVFPAESFPTQLRSSGIGFATAMSRLGSVVSTYLLPIILTAWGISGTMFVLGGCLLVGTIVSIAWAPETKHLNLSEAAH